MTHRTQTPFRYMSNFKAVAADWEYFSSLSDEGQLYCLSEQQIYVLLVQLEYVGWLTRWYNTDDINQTTVDRVKSDIMEALMSCVDIQVLIDQAKITASHETTNQLLQSQEIRDILADRYDGTPTSINPSAPTTDFGASGDRYTALCAAITAFVYKFAANQASVIRLNEVGGAAAVALIAALLIPGLNIFLLVGAGIAVLLGFGVIGVSSETAIAALTDQAALNDVICFMRDTLMSESVTEANWNACLDSYPFGVGTHQAIVADFIKATLADNYLSVLDMLGQGYDSVLANDDLPDCPCPPDMPRYPQTDGNEIFNGQHADFIGYDGLWDVWEGPAFDISPYSVVLDGVTYTAGLNIRLVSTDLFYIEDVSGSDWALWVNDVGDLENARHFPGAGGGVQIAQMNATAGTLIRFKIRPQP